MSQNEPNESTEQNEGTSSKQRSNIFRTTMTSLHNLFKRTKTIDGESTTTTANKPDAIDVESDRNEVPAAVSSPIQHQPGEIFKLDIDCFGEIFDYLSLEDLISIGATCKRMSQVAGYFLQQNYPGSNASCKDYSIWIDSSHRANHFVKSIRKVHLCHKFRYVVDHQSEFHRLRQIELEHAKIDASEFESMKNIWSKIEWLRLVWCELPYNSGFHKMVLNNFPNLKYLSITSIPRGPIIIGTDNKWLRHTYPTLEHLELVLFGDPVIQELKTFLEINPNIKSFITFAKCFWANRKSLLKADIKLDEFAVNINYDNWADFDEFCNLLHELYSRGFYKRLHLQYIYRESNQAFVERLASLDALVKLCINVTSDISLCAFSNLEELFIDASDQITDLEVMATNLTKLERIRFRYSNLEHISVLVSRAVRLKKVVVDTLLDDTRSIRDWLEFSDEEILLRRENITIDLQKLNMERDKMADARKVTIYVEEDIFLANKWTLNDTNLDLVRLMRKQSYERINSANI